MLNAELGVRSLPWFLPVILDVLLWGVSSLCTKLSIDTLRGMSQDAVPRAVHTLIFREAQGEGTGVEDVSLVIPEPEQPLSTEGLSS